MYAQLAAERPGDAVVLARLGTCRLFTSRGAEGREELEAAAELGSKDALLHAALGYARTEAGELEGALAAYATAFELDPTRLGTRRGLGTTQAALGRHREAAENLQAVWDRGQGDDGMRAQIARSWAGCGEDERAIEALRAVADAGPGALAEVLADPSFDAIRHDGRVVELLERTGRTRGQER